MKLLGPLVLGYNSIFLSVYLLFAFNVLFWYGFTDIYEEGLNEEKNLSRGNSTSGSEISCVDSGRKKIQDCHTALPKEQDTNIDEPEKTLSWNLASKLGPRMSVPSADSLDIEVTEILMLLSNVTPRTQHITTYQIHVEGKVTVKKRRQKTLK